MPLNPVPNWPASLDSLPDPTSANFEDDDGFEIDLLLQKHNAILEALEAAFGISESSPQNTPLADMVITSLTTGKYKWGKVLTAMLAANAVTQSGYASGVSGTTTTSASYVDMADMSVTLTTTTTGGDVLVWFNSTVSHSLAANYIFLAIQEGANTPVADRQVTASGAGEIVNCSTFYRFTGLSAGSHTFKGKWLTQAATATGNTTQRSLLAVELKK